MWNSRTLEIQVFKSPLAHIFMGYNVYDVLNNIVTYNTIKCTLKYIFLGDDLKLWSFYKMKQNICKEYVHFVNCDIWGQLK